MANKDNVREEKIEYESSDKVDYCNFLEYPKDELTHALINCIRCKQEYFSKIKSLKKTIHDLFFKKETLQKSNNESYSKLKL